MGICYYHLSPLRNISALFKSFKVSFVLMITGQYPLWMFSPVNNKAEIPISSKKTGQFQYLVRKSGQLVDIQQKTGQF